MIMILGASLSIHPCHISAELQSVSSSLGQERRSPFTRTIPMTTCLLEYEMVPSTCSLFHTHTPILVLSFPLLIFSTFIISSLIVIALSSLVLLTQGVNLGPIDKTLLALICLIWKESF